VGNYFVSVPRIIRLLFRKSLICHFSDKEKVLYLSFDDGPIPDLTPDILRVLQHFGVKATFFCVGENLERYPFLVKQIEEQGHEIGNHTYNHLKGWISRNKEYYANVQRFEKVYSSPLFRPPYGKMKWSQMRKISRRYKIILWSVLTYDFDASLSAEDCLTLAVNNSFPGAILVFHDNIKAKEKVLKVLPLYIEQMLRKGYRFELIGNRINTSKV